MLAMGRGCSASGSRGQGVGLLSAWVRVRPAHGWRLARVPVGTACCFVPVKDDVWCNQHVTLS